MTNTWDQYMASAEEAYRGGNPIQAQRHWMLAVKAAEDAGDLKRAGMALDRLADALIQMEQFADAEFVLNLAVEVKEELYGAQHFEVIGSLNHLVDALHAQAKYEEALPSVKRLLDAYRATFGDEHPGLAAIAAHMAHAYHQELHPAAEGFYTLAIGIKTKTLGFKHEEVGRLNYKYAEFLKSIGREQDAKNVSTAETVSGVWNTVAEKMAERTNVDKLSIQRSDKLSAQRRLIDRSRRPEPS